MADGVYRIKPKAGEIATGPVEQLMNKSIINELVIIRLFKQVNQYHLYPSTLPLAIHNDNIHICILILFKENGRGFT